MKEVVKEIKVSKFIANDGKEFDTECACKAHERELSDAIKRLKKEKIFGTPYQDWSLYWIRGDESSRWYDIKIETEDDLIDFLATTEGWDTYDGNGHSFQEKAFTDEVLSVIRNGEVFTKMIYADTDNGYLTMVRGGEINEKEYYEKMMGRINNLRKIADKVEALYKFVPKEETEN